MRPSLEGDGKGPLSRLHLPLVLPVTPRPPLVIRFVFYLFLFSTFFHVFLDVCAVGTVALEVFLFSQPYRR
jgi:hypothetical protein